MEHRQLGRDGPLVSVLRQPALTCALVGAKSLAQVEEHLGAVGVTFAAHELAAIERILADAPQG